MTANTFIKTLKKNKEVECWEYKFILLSDGKVEAYKNNVKENTDTPFSIYWIYRNIISCWDKKNPMVRKRTGIVFMSDKKKDDILNEKIDNIINEFDNKTNE